MSDLSEQDVRDRLITPALEKSGWSADMRRAEYSYRKDYQFTDGRIDVREGKVARQKGKRVDYLLFKDSSHAIAVVEAKDANHEVDDGLQQAKDYANDLDLKFAYASNGKGFVEYDFFTGLTRNYNIDDFPTLDNLVERYRQESDMSDDVAKALDTPFYYDPDDGKEPRYYQRIAVDRIVEAAAKGRKRMLLVMATGTGKTFTAFQIVHRLRQASIAKKVLYLVDRNILADQTLAQDFKSLKNVSVKVEQHNLDPAYEVYFALYPQLVEPGKEYYKDFAPDFFDLIIVDECHRSSVDENKNYHKILDYFSPAIQIGMTATPKETADKSNISYFGEPIYTYSLKDGIEDGYLAPYEVIKVDINKDINGYRPEEGKTDVEGDVIEDRIYKRNDFDKNIIIDERTQIVANRITEYLKATNRYARTIVFCVDQEHAGRMRKALANVNADMMRENPDYVVRITAGDQAGKNKLDDFVDKNTIYPVIATTSQLLSTGVDTKTVKLIVIDKVINSMTEFKQIIGRGTRLVVGKNVPKDKQKAYFTIMDFRDATNHFADPDFDGEPEQAVEWKEGESADKMVSEMKVAPLQQKKEMLAGKAEPEKERKVHVNGVDVKIVDENVEYYNPVSGKLINEKMDDFVRRYLLKSYSSKNDFVTAWQNEPVKKDILNKLFSGGNMFNGLIEKYGNDYDIFDILLKVGYDMPLIDKQVRIDKVTASSIYRSTNGEQRLIIDELLNSYKASGVTELEDINLLSTKKFEDNFGGMVKIAKLFGGINGYWNVIATIKRLLYS